MRRIGKPNDIDKVEKRYKANFDEFQAIYENQVTMFCNSINCHSIYHAFHMCRRIGAGIMFWAKSIEIKHKSCKEQIRNGNKRNIITSAANHLQLRFAFGIYFPDSKFYSGFSNLKDDIYHKNLLELPSCHTHKKEYKQTKHLKYLHKDITQESIICAGNEKLNNVEYLTTFWLI